ncbi:MAG: SpoIID/LytB domain-containing protein [Oscillospiraceae bacterium]|nr:SpoIID/LytB domain-containing protein [Oscillospiraceae bacterium]
MRNFSLAKLFAALLICNIYLFTCAVSGTVSEAKPQDQNKQSDDFQNDNTHGGTIDFIVEDNVVDTGGSNELETLELVNFGFAKPTFAQKPLNSSYTPTSTVKSLAGLASSSSSTTTSTNTPIIVSMPEPVSSEPVSSEPVSSEPTSSEPESSEPDNSSEPIIPNDPNPDAANEILRVKNSGREESGKAIDIVSRIVQNEVGNTFAPEAIKANAVAAYTYVKYQNLHGNTPQCVLKDTASESVRTLVASVIGEAIYYDGTLIQAVYFASSAGGTLSSADVWGGDLPYLQRVECDFDAQFDPNYGKETMFTAAEMKQYVKNETGINLTGDPAYWFEIENRISGKYVGDMKIGDKSYYNDSSNNSVEITGRRFRENIMGYAIRSSAFDISYNSSTDKFTITTYGYGHGVGLSQHGSNILAREKGWDYIDILTFYFTGTEIY